MANEKTDYSRRDFLKTAGAVGLGSMLSPIDNMIQAKELHAANDSQQNLVPTRPFGKTGVNVSILSLGGVLGMSDLIVFRQAMKMGVTYWDTADSYGRGKNERQSVNILLNSLTTEKKCFWSLKPPPRIPRN
jgi:hypothetical protein